MSKRLFSISDNHNIKHICLLIAFFCLSYLLTLGCRELTVPDETRYGEIPREMINNSSWFNPRLNGVHYFEKPGLGYWIHAASIMICGENNFAIRLPSALSAGFTALLLYLTAGPYGLLSAFIFLSCLGGFCIGNFALLDSLFSFFLTSAIITFYLATEQQAGNKYEKIFLISAGLFCGAAFLTKGFLAFLIPVISLGAYLIWQKRYFDLLRMGLLPIAVSLLLILPWAFATHLKEPDFWRFFFWNEHVRRFISENAQHNRPFWFFLVVAPIMCLPWTFTIPTAIAGLRDKFPKLSDPDNIIKMSLCWLGMPFIFFSISKGKLPTYILPCLPPFAILMASGLTHSLSKRNNRLFNRGIEISMIFAIILLFCFAYLHFHGYGKIHHVYDKSWKSLMFTNTIIFFLLVCTWARKTESRQNKIILFSLSPLLFFTTLNLLIPEQTIISKSPGILLRRNKDHIDKNIILISDEATAGAACWYFKRDDIYILGAPGELDYGLNREEAKNRLLSPEKARKIIIEHKNEVILTARTRNLNKWENLLPEPVFTDTSGPSGYVLLKF
jgi:4-amino-4-deoxy-L-arabinose transferase